MVISSEKYDVKQISKSLFETRLVLVVRKFHQKDVGSYRCIAKNSLGEVESGIRLYEIPRSSSNGVRGSDDNYGDSDDDDDDGLNYGSAEDPDDEVGGNTVPQRGHMTHLATLVPPVLGVFKTHDSDNDVVGAPGRGGSRHKGVSSAAAGDARPPPHAFALLALALAAAGARRPPV
ncbi:Uncharacterized protein GBIM_20453 [Gryllus bimaculatus]|nr:Uncharacterized protein GBIM_20453 [Gryllus bimaculatus]